MKNTPNGFSNPAIVIRPIGSKSSDVLSPVRNTRIKPTAVYDLRHQLMTICNEVALEARASQIELSQFIAEDLPVAFWDIDSLRIDVFNTILSNAVRFTPAGGKIRVSIEMSGDYAMTIKVSDSGAGIQAATVDRIFQNNIRCMNAKNDAGLFRARVCVQAHKGSLSIVDDPEYSGTTIKIELPLYSLCMQ